MLVGGEVILELQGWVLGRSVGQREGRDLTRGQRNPLAQPLGYLLGLLWGEGAEVVEGTGSNLPSRVAERGGQAVIDMVSHGDRFEMYAARSTTHGEGKNRGRYTIPNADGARSLRS